MPLPQAKIPWCTRLGTIGESAIKSRLAYFSNPTKYEEDAGIDFYCELIENNSPSLPFYVQAKGTTYFDNCWGSGIPKSTISYWLQQQHPVFLIVYDDETTTCHWMSIEDYRYSLIQKIFATDSKTVYIKMNRSNILQPLENGNEAFIAKIKEDSNSVQLFRGRPQFFGEGYVRDIPQSPRSNIELHDIRETARACLYSLVRHYITKEKDFGIAYNYCKFLVDFDKSHYNHFVWLGQLSREFGDTGAAKENFEQALRICKADQNWPKESMDEIIADIEGMLQSL